MENIVNLNGRKFVRHGRITVGDYINMLLDESNISKFIENGLLTPKF